MISYYAENDKYFVELMPIAYVEDGSVTEKYNITSTTSVRYKRAKFDVSTTAIFEKRGVKQVSNKAEINNHFILKEYANFSFHFTNKIHT